MRYTTQWQLYWILSNVATLLLLLLLVILSYIFILLPIDDLTQVQGHLLPGARGRDQCQGPAGDIGDC